MNKLALMAVAALFAGSLCAAVEVGDMGPNFKFDKSWNFGAGVDELDDLKGNIILVERWATWCGPCMAMIPHLTEIHEHYGEKGFIIASVSDEQEGVIQSKMIDAKKPKYGIVKASINATYETRGIPHAWVLGADGKCLWKGHPNSLTNEMIEGWIKDLAPTKVDKALAKELGSAVKSFDKGEYGKAHAEAKAVAETATDDLVKADAAYLESLVQKHIDLHSAKIEKAGSDPVAKAKVLDDAATKFKGSELGTKWDTESKELKKSKEFKDANASADELNKLRGKLDDMKPASARKALEKIAKKYPEAPAGKEAAELAKKYEE